VRPGWRTQAQELDRQARLNLRKRFDDLGLMLPAVNESLPLLVHGSKHTDNLERLRQGAGLFHDLAPGRTAVLETVLGSRSAQWEQVKRAMVDRLGEWSELARASDMVIAFKPHASQAADTPERARWLIEQVNSKWIRIAFDYSHFEVIGRTLPDCLNQLLPLTALILVKDASGNPKEFTRLLPGDGRVDYTDYFRRLKAANYGGDVVVEVSAQIHTRPDYRPEETARHCYASLAPAFEKAGLNRRSRKHA